MQGIQSSEAAFYYWNQCKTTYCTSKKKQSKGHPKLLFIICQNLPWKK